MIGRPTCSPQYSLVSPYFGIMRACAQPASASGGITAGRHAAHREAALPWAPMLLPSARFPGATASN